MIDIKQVRENFSEVEKNLKKRGDDSVKLVRELKKIDESWRKKKREADNLRAERNKISEKINERKKSGKDVKDLLQRAKQISNKLDKVKGEEDKLEEKERGLLLKIPNLLARDVPYGKDEKENKVIRKYGEAVKKKVIPATELMKKLNLVDIERAAKTSGSRFYFLKNELARLDYALMCFTLDLLKKKGYEIIEPPYMLRRKAYEGAIILQDFEDVIYKIEDEDLYLIATSEHAIAALHMDEVLKLSKPLKYAGVSTCFRKEAGSHGKDTKGIFRVHQFNKVEQFIFCKKEESENLHQELLKNLEEIFKKLKLPFRTVLLCSGDTGKVSSKTYDVEVWIPSQKKYREAGSCSNCKDYQARRLNIRYYDKKGRSFCHTLNSTAVATTRALIAIIENYQQKDGSIKIPSVLVPYCGFKKIKPKR